MAFHMVELSMIMNRDGSFERDPPNQEVFNASIRVLQTGAMSFVADKFVCDSISVFQVLNGLFSTESGAFVGDTGDSLA